jgi:ligand-binding SRPBCC domain-containing protein
MPIIELETKINSSLEICFDLSRSIDLHKISTIETNEKAISGVTSGLIGLNESVTWQANHFGVEQQLTSKISKFDRLNYFQDVQVKGAFKHFTHDHNFKLIKGIVIMKDRFHFESPFGILGKIFNQIILTKYMKDLLIKRNNVIKEFAESDKWKSVLNA